MDYFCAICFSNKNNCTYWLLWHNWLDCNFTISNTILLNCKYNCQGKNPVFSIMNHILIFIDSISGVTWHFNYCHKLFSEADATRSTSNGTLILGELYTSCMHVCVCHWTSRASHYIISFVSKLFILLGFWNGEWEAKYLKCLWQCFCLL